VIGRKFLARTRELKLIDNIFHRRSAAAGMAKEKYVRGR